MSHNLFHHSILSDPCVWAFLKQVDEAEAEVCRKVWVVRIAAEFCTARPTLASRMVWRPGYGTVSGASASAAPTAGVA